MIHSKDKLSILWLFVTLNYLYCDVVTVMDPSKLKQFASGTVNGFQISPEFLLGASILVEVPIAMVLFSKILKPSINKWANIAAGIIMTVVQFSTLLGTPPTSYYLFFSILEITTTLFIVFYAWKWDKRNE
jgi:hypothetical protein